MKLIQELKLKVGYTKSDVIFAIAKKAKVNISDIASYEILKEGIDARNKPNVFYVLNVAVEFSGASKGKTKHLVDVFPNHKGLEFNSASAINYRPVIVGFGPSGMFCALSLALAGLKPIVLEQGKSVDERQKDVENFWHNRVLNEHSNVQFGEGGAGTFSDGKLNTTLNNEYCLKVINELILNGAPKEIYYKNKAHIGTDNLKNVVQNIRKKIISLGGDVIFNAYFKEFETLNGNICSVTYEDLTTSSLKTIKTSKLILAIGHSAFNTFKYLKGKAEMRKKPFAMGVRVQQPQSVINLAQYGINDSRLPSADYKLVTHLPSGRSVFTFCMCPGGVIVGSSSDRESVVTNGMSNFARDGEYANSALLVNVTPDDFKGDDVLEGFYFQKKYERLAYLIAGSNYNAPAQTVGAFLNDRLDESINNCTYLPNVTPCKIKDCLPDFVTTSLKEALKEFDKKIKGFSSSSNLLVGVETRSSCPVQFVRSDNYVCTISGLYACGEGAGYAGGIISSAVDGVKCAISILNSL